MAVRNSSIEVDIDGRKAKLRGGPQSRTGWMQSKLLVRNQGAKHNAIEMSVHEEPGHGRDEVVVLGSVDVPDDGLVGVAIDGKWYYPKTGFGFAIYSPR